MADNERVHAFIKPWLEVWIRCESFQHFELGLFQRFLSDNLQMGIMFWNNDPTSPIVDPFIIMLRDKGQLLMAGASSTIRALQTTTGDRLRYSNWQSFEVCCTMHVVVRRIFIVHILKLEVDNIFLLNRTFLRRLLFDWLVILVQNFRIVEL